MSPSVGLIELFGSDSESVYYLVLWSLWVEFILIALICINDLLGINHINYVIIIEK